MLFPDLFWVQYSPCLGGFEEDEGRTVAFDPNGAVLVCGWSRSDVFPTVGATAFQLDRAGLSDGFIAHFILVLVRPSTEVD